MTFFDPEIPHPSHKFEVSNYRVGTYQPNGNFSPESLLNSEGISNWERSNANSDNKLWGRGQALRILTNQPLVFGRSLEADVRIDLDPDENGIAISDFAVSRRHFELTKNNHSFLIKDLDSRNGVRVFGGDDKSRDVDLKGTSFSLSQDDFVIVGGVEPLTGGRMIGFRVCKDLSGEMFLVKFNARNLEDLMPLRKVDMGEDLKERSGLEEDLRKSFAELAVKLAREETAVLESGQFSIAKMEATRNLSDALFKWTIKLAEEHFEGKCDIAAAKIGQKAIEEFEKAKLNNNHELQVSALKISIMALKLANDKLLGGEN